MTRLSLSRLRLRTLSNSLVALRLMSSVYRMRILDREKVLKMWGRNSSYLDHPICGKVHPHPQQQQ